MTTEELRELKKRAGYTNRQLAELSGVPLGTLQKILNGETKSPRRDTLRALEAVFIRAGIAAGHGMNTGHEGDMGSSAGRVEEEAFSYTTEKRPGEYTIEDYYSLPDNVRCWMITYSGSSCFLYSLSPHSMS